jgi:hypothetical protein
MFTDMLAPFGQLMERLVECPHCQLLPIAFTFHPALQHAIYLVEIQMTQIRINVVLGVQMERVTPAQLSGFVKIMGIN